MPAAQLDDVLSANSLRMLNIWLRSHPVRMKALSRADLRIAAAHILLRKQSSTRGGAWPAKSSKIAAILLVLYVQEGLICQSETILSLSMPELFEMLREEVHARGLSREQPRPSAGRRSPRPHAPRRARRRSASISRATRRQ